MDPDYRQFVPLNSLSDEALGRALSQSREIRLAKGQALFQKGDEDDLSYYLLQGEFALEAGDGSPPLVIRSGSESARHPLARLKPRLYSGVAQKDCLLVSFPDDDLDGVVAQDQATSYEVQEFEGDDPTWMFQLLSNPAFSRVPPANLHGLFGKFEPLEVSAGQALIRQGEAGDYYYLIREGAAQVTREAGGGKSVILAKLDAGQGFGEEALISGEPRNATVTMTSDGLLMRLAADDFRALLQSPLVNQVDVAEAAGMVRDKGAQLIDVRLEDEFKQGSLKGAINIPLYLLRLKANTLPKERIHIVFCQTGSRSSTAGFLLAQRGFEARVLKGGLAGIPQAGG
ncbi:MAG: cyclic nucleotide-binding domain-containing protein [Pseudomonadota bacterium]